MENIGLETPQFKNPEEEINFLRRKVAEKEKVIPQYRGRVGTDRPAEIRQAQPLIPAGIEALNGLHPN